MTELVVKAYISMMSRGVDRTWKSVGSQRWRTCGWWDWWCVAALGDLHPMGGGLRLGGRNIGIWGTCPGFPAAVGALCCLVWGSLAYCVGLFTIADGLRADAVCLLCCRKGDDVC